jgi:hypothetical protein
MLTRGTSHDLHEGPALTTHVIVFFTVCCDRLTLARSLSSTLPVRHQLRWYTAAGDLI